VAPLKLSAPGLLAGRWRQGGVACIWLKEVWQGPSASYRHPQETVTALIRCSCSKMAEIWPGKDHEALARKNTAQSLDEALAGAECRLKQATGVQKVHACIPCTFALDSGIQH